MADNSSLITRHSPLATVLSIAGSDSGGGAGIQADLRAFTSLGTFGTTAVTCITAQNPAEVLGVEPIIPEMVVLQIKAVCKHFLVAAAKTGMLYSADIIEAVAGAIEENHIKNLVVDPVMVATSGVRLLQEDAIEALCSSLLPMAKVITPNVPELEILCGHEVKTLDDMKNAAVEVGLKYDVAVAAKGGHLLDYGLQTTDRSSVIVDVLYVGGEISEFSGERVEVESTHGTGCSFAAALAASIAQGKPLKEALPIAKDYVRQYISI